jgi:PKD repeat protein
MEPLETRSLLSGDPAIGIGLDGITYYSSAWTFTDAFKASSKWSATTYNTMTKVETSGAGGEVEMDANGWPVRLKNWTNDQGQLMQQRLYTLMFRDIGDKYPAGIYRAEWKGTGSVTFGMAARVVEQGTSNGIHYALLNVTPTKNGIQLKINDMDPANPIRDIHVWMSDYNGQSFAGQVWQPGAKFSPFHPLFLERLKPFKTLRFKDWGALDGSILEHWSDRPTVDDAGYRWTNGRGVAYEYMIELANELDADAWFNMPHMADDDFIRNFATLVRDNLEPGRKVYIEWSNEIWNYAPSFTTYSWITEQLKKPENAGMDRPSFEAREIKRDFDIWSEVFQGQQDRLVRVIAGQASNSWSVIKQLKKMDGHFDAVSAAGYLKVKDILDTFSESTTAREIVQALLDYVPTKLGHLQNYKDLADQYSAELGRHIQFVVYEGGQALIGNNAPYQQAMFDAQVDPLMYQAYAELLKGFRAMGGDLFTFYTYINPDNRYGSWGALQYQNQPIADAPKYQAIVDAATGALYYPAPVADAGESYTVAEGGSVELSAGGSTGHLLSYAWDLDGDGIFGETGPAAKHGDETGVNPTFLAAGLNGPSVWMIALRVNDGHGRRVTTTAPVSISNTPPALGLREYRPADEGSLYWLYLSASDPGPDTVGTWQINWGDGVAQSVVGNNVWASHTFADNGNYTIAAAATDTDGTYPADPWVTAVANAAPVLGLDGADAALQSSLYRLNLLASDQGDDTINFWIINWGDGTTQTVAGHPSYVAHTYAAYGDYLITAAATDEDGAYSAGIRRLTVRKQDSIAPTAALAYGSSILLVRSTEVATYNSYLFTVRYSDNIGISLSSLSKTNLLISKGTFSQAPVLKTAKLQTDGSVLATYAFVPPGGKWDTADNGAYALKIGSGPATDTSSNPVPAQTLGVFQVYLSDSSPTPIAVALDAAAVIGVSGTRSRTTRALAAVAQQDVYRFTVTYAPEGFAIDGDTVGDGDLLVTNKLGYKQVATLISKQRGGTKGSVMATYSIIAPGGLWDSADNSAYTIRLLPKQILDTQGRAIAKAILGKFAVKIPSPALTVLATGGASPSPTTGQTTALSYLAASGSSRAPSTTTKPPSITAQLFSTSSRIQY